MSDSKQGRRKSGGSRSPARSVRSGPGSPADPLHRRLPSIFLKEPPGRATAYFRQILGYGLAEDALRAMERSVPVMEAIAGRGGSAPAAERSALLRGFYARFLMRAGHYAQARLHLQRWNLGTAQHSFMRGLVEVHFRNHVGALKHFQDAAGRIDADPTHALALMNAKCHAFSSEGVPRDVLVGMVREAESLLPRLEAEDHSGWVTNRLAEMHRLAGTPGRSLELTESKLFALAERALEGKPVSTLYLADLHVEAARALRASGGSPNAVREHLDEALKHVLEHAHNYAYLLVVLGERVMAGVAKSSELHVLQALSGNLPGFDLAGLWRVAQPPLLARRSPQGKLWIDLARDEFRVEGEATPILGIPLEVRLIGWVALFSQLGAVPRSLLLDLLWSDAPAPITALQNRLSKLVARAEEVYGVQLRDPKSGELRVADQDLNAVHVGIGPAGLVPSYFLSSARPEVAGLAEFYGLSKRQARAWMQLALERGWLMEPAAQRGPRPPGDEKRSA